MKHQIFNNNNNTGHMQMMIKGECRKGMSNIGAYQKHAFPRYPKLCHSKHQHPRETADFQITQLG